MWTLPNPAVIHDRIQADGSSEREHLEDVELELLLYMHKLAAEKGMTIPPGNDDGLASADKDVERTLAAQSCTFAQT